MDGSTVTASTFEQIQEEYHRAVAEFIKGNPEPNKQVFSHRDDVSLSNPLGPTAVGWEQVEVALDHAAATLSEGQDFTVEDQVTYATPELAFTVGVERCQARISSRQELVSIVLRVTTIFRREGDRWTVVHRHADPITSPRPIESAIQQ
jgi:ketosteroid isomerase-like protein